MKVKTRQRGDVVVVDLSGRIMIGKGDVLLRETVQRLLDGGRKRILLNLRKVSHMDSAGIGEMFACYKKAKQSQASLKLLNPTGKLYGVLDVAQVGQVIETYREEEEALESF